MTGAEIDMLQEIGKLPPQVFTITKAQDWPMFLAMLKLTGIIIAVAWTSIVGLMLYSWKDLKNTIADHREEDDTACADCKKRIWEHISGPVWSAIESCCPRWSDSDKARLRDEIKQNTGTAQ